MNSCLFCKIINKTLPAQILFEDTQCLCFQDILAQAPFHALIVPRKHIATLNDITVEDNALMGHMLSITAAIAKRHGYADSGYRTVINCNQDAGQSVFHIHIHLLAGRSFNWPPG